MKTEVRLITGRSLVADIEELTLGNENFRTTAWTGKYMQMTLMTIQPGDDIGLEVHEDHDQFLRIEQGLATVLMGDSEESLESWDDMLRRINVRALVWRDGKVLAVKHKNEDGSATDHWALPGGGLDPMESLVEAVRREVYEELGVESVVGELVAVQQFRSKRDGFDEELEVFFNVKDSPAFDSINLNETTHGADELADVAFVDPAIESILPDLLRTMDIDAVLRQKAPVVVENYL